MNVTMSVMGGPTKTARYFITKLLKYLHTVSTDDLKHAIVIYANILFVRTSGHGRKVGEVVEEVHRVSIRISKDFQDTLTLNTHSKSVKIFTTNTLTRNC